MSYESTLSDIMNSRGRQNDGLEIVKRTFAIYPNAKVTDVLPNQDSVSVFMEAPCMMTMAAEQWDVTTQQWIPADQ